MIAKKFVVKEYYQSISFDERLAELEQKTLSNLRLVNRRMHEAMVSTEARWGKQLGYTKTARSLKVKCPFGNHYHCCVRHVCEVSDELE